MSRILYSLAVLGTVSACGMQERHAYNTHETRNYNTAYSYDDRGYWSPDQTSFRSSSSPEGRWIYERGRNQRN